jgi:hypothetical protein
MRGNIFHVAKFGQQIDSGTPIDGVVRGRAFGKPHAGSHGGIKLPELCPQSPIRINVYAEKYPKMRRADQGKPSHTAGGCALRRSSSTKVNVEQQSRTKEQRGQQP